MHFGFQTPNCKNCLPNNGFKFISVILLGSLIGYVASQYVQPPPSVRLLLESKHNRDMKDVLINLDNMSKDIVIIKNELLDIKKKLIPEE